MNWIDYSKGFFQSFVPQDKTATDFEVLKSNISLDYSEADLKYLDTKSPVLLVCNRPMGNVEELFLEVLTEKIGKKIYFEKNEYLKEAFAPVQQLDQKTLLDFEAEDSLPVAFPVGTLSKFQSPNKSFADSKWDKKLLSKIYKSEANIVPVYLRIKDNPFAEWLGMMHPAMRTMYIARSLKTGTNIRLQVKVGRPIRNKEKQQFFNANQFGRYLRAKLYSLGSALEVKSFYVKPNVVEEIQPAQEKSLLLKEINSLRKENKLAEQSGFEIFLSKAKKMPHLMQEIGRLREITFRAVGEGSNKAVDLDEYDLYYLHLFVWDKEKKKIVGAYRLGAGDYIMQSYGKKGFYLRSLFKIQDEMDGVLRESVEMGRSFVVEEYQQHRLPLFLLWQGIYTYLNREGKFKYLIGPVSISGTYSDVSLSLIKQFVEQHYFDQELAQWVKPRKAFKPNFKGLDHESLLEIAKSDPKKMDQLIADIEPGKLKMPILLKKYFAQNAKIIGFNVDPDFNNTLDGFMLCRIKELPEEIKERFSL